MKAGDIVTIEGKKYMAHNGDCGDCDIAKEDLTCPEGCSCLIRLCDNWDEGKSECKIYTYGGTFVDTDGHIYTMKTSHDYCDGCYCPSYQVIEDNIQ